MIGLIFYPQDPSNGISTFHYDFKNCICLLTLSLKYPLTIYNSANAQTGYKIRKNSFICYLDITILNFLSILLGKYYFSIN